MKNITQDAMKRGRGGRPGDGMQPVAEPAQRCSTLLDPPASRVFAVLAAACVVLGAGSCFAIPPAPPAVLIHTPTWVEWDAVTNDTEGAALSGVRYEVLRADVDAGSNTVWTVATNTAATEARLDWPLGWHWCTVVAVATNGARSAGSNVLEVPAKAKGPAAPAARKR